MGITIGLLIPLLGTMLGAAFVFFMPPSKRMFCDLAIIQQDKNRYKTKILFIVFKCFPSVPKSHLFRDG